MLTGYDIKRKVDSVISNFWSVGYGQIYPTLKSMEEQDLLKKHTQDTVKGTEKNVYAITDKGHERLQCWLMEDDKDEQLRIELLLKIYFGNVLTKDMNIKRIESFKEKSLLKVKLMKEFEKSLEKVLHENDDHGYYYLTALFGDHLYQAYVNWSHDAINFLNERKAAYQDENPE